jgi:hypothetical protein
MGMIRVGESVIRGRYAWAFGVVALFFAVVGCSATSVSTTPTPAVGSPSSIGPTPSASRTASADAVGLALVPVPGYTYTDPPAELKQAADGLDATGMVTSTVGRGVQDGSGAKVGAIMLAQYNPKLTVILDQQTPSQNLDPLTKAFEGQPGKTVTTHVLSGNQVRLLQGADASIAFAYRHGGVLIEVIGVTPARALSFTGAYLAASANS